MSAESYKSFTWNYETLAHLSGWPSDRIRQDISRGVLKADDLRSTVVWLAANGNPALRSEIAKQVVPVVLGTVKRRDNNGLANIASSHDVMLQIFKRDDSLRHARGDRVSKMKLKKAKKS